MADATPCACTRCGEPTYQFKSSGRWAKTCRQCKTAPLPKPYDRERRSAAARHAAMLRWSHQAELAAAARWGRTMRRTEPAPCDWCGQAVPPPPPSQPGPSPRWVYCSDDHRIALAKNRGPRPTGRKCQICGSNIDHRYANAIQCGSSECKNAARRRPSTQTFKCQDCGDMWERPTSRGLTPKWCPQCRPRHHHGTPVSRATRLAVLERDGWVCQICLDPLDRSVHKNHDLYPTVDHIIPKSKGGTHDPDNLRAAHRWCNSVRSDESAYSDSDFRSVA